jgi:hypothetical protein
VTGAIRKNWSVVCLFGVLLVCGALLALTGKLAHAGDALLTVRVLTDRASYARGERIVVTIYNDLATFLYAPPRKPYCSVISVQRLEGGKWVPKESCMTPARSDPPSVIALAPRSRTWGTLGETARASRLQDSIVSEPVKPFATQKSLRPPPPAEPWKPGEPIPEIPEGGLRPPFGALDGVLEPGTYRIEFTFAIGGISGPAQTVHSKEFVVTG